MEWSRRRNGKGVAVPALVRKILKAFHVLPVHYRKILPFSGNHEIELSLAPPTKESGFRCLGQGGWPLDTPYTAL